MPGCLEVAGDRSPGRHARRWPRRSAGASCIATIKPHNILLRPRRPVCVTDFGIARVIDQNLNRAHLFEPVGAQHDAECQGDSEQQTSETAVSMVRSMRGVMRVIGFMRTSFPQQRSLTSCSSLVGPDRCLQYGEKWECRHRQEYRFVTGESDGNRVGIGT